MAAPCPTTPRTSTRGEGFVAAGIATDEQVHAAITHLDRLTPTRPHWRLHPEPGENDKTQLMMAGVVIVAVVIALYVMSGTAAAIVQEQQASLQAPSREAIHPQAGSAEAVQ